MEMVVVLSDVVNLASLNLNQQLLKRGDVIDALPDGFNWAAFPGVIAQLKSGAWGIIKSPTATKQDANSLLAPEAAPDTIQKYVLRPRAVGLNLLLIGPTAVGDQTNKTTITRTALLAAVVTKTAPMVDTTAVVIGPTSSNVIGPV